MLTLTFERIKWTFLTVVIYLLENISSYVLMLYRKKSGKIKSAFKQDYVNLNCDVDFDFAGPTIHGAGVLG